MKRLFFIRHAHAPGAPGLPDQDRVLSACGQSEARMLGRVMRERGYRPDIVYCSSAQRTRQTLKGLSESFGPLRTEYLHDLYNASCAEHLHFIQTRPARVERLVILAHNPGIYEITALLAQTNASALADELMRGFAPATMAVLAYGGTAWADIKPGENPLLDVWTPRL